MLGPSLPVVGSGPNGADLSRGTDESASYRRIDKQSVEWMRHFPRRFPALGWSGTVFRALPGIPTDCFLFERRPPVIVGLPHVPVRSCPNDDSGPPGGPAASWPAGAFILDLLSYCYGEKRIFPGGLTGWGACARLLGTEAGARGAGLGEVGRS